MSYDLYSLLGISPDSSVEEVKAAYKRLVSEHYSRKYQSANERKIEEERFKKITSAYYSILNNITSNKTRNSKIVHDHKEPDKIKDESDLEREPGETVDHEEGKPVAFEHFEKGKTSFDKGNHKDAVMHFKNAIRFYPDDGRFHNYLGLVYAKQKLFKMAITSCEKALTVNQNDQNLPLFHRDYGLILEGSGDLIKARTHFEEALKLDPNDNISKQHLSEVKKKWKIVTKQKVSVFIYIASGIALVFYFTFIYYSSR